jgi:5-methylcytosine-specific restriction endonuclease McrA
MPKNRRIQSLRRQAFERQGGRCYYCGVCMWLTAPTELPGAPQKASAWPRLRCTAEHLLAQSEGGRDTLSNIAAACALCNHTRHKRKKPPEPHAYRAEVRRRMKGGAWHQRWVHERGLAVFARPA